LTPLIGGVVVLSHLLISRGGGTLAAAERTELDPAVDTVFIRTDRTHARERSNVRL